MDAQKILDGLNKLDRANDNHWTADMKPRLEAVRLLAGDQTISREDVELAATGFSRLLPQENGDAPGTGQFNVGAAAASQSSVEEDGVSPFEAATRRVDEARKRKAEADQEYASAQAARDALIEDNANPAETTAQQIQHHQAAQRKILEERARRIEAMKGVDLKSILPTKTPLDQAFARKTGRGTTRPGG